MVKEEYKFEDFLEKVSDDYKEFAKNTHNAFAQDGYKAKIESKATGYFISYSHPKTKRVIMNFLFRKSGMLVRIYADNISEYPGFLDALPETMVKEINKASVCKRMVDPDDCNQRCVMGYDFKMNDTHYQKCRYSCFQFLVTAESLPFLSDFIENERKLRA